MTVDPVIQALDAVSRTLLDLAARVVPAGEGEWDSSRYLPGGDRYIPKLTIYGTGSAMSFIPLDSAETLAERDRANRAWIALETLRSEPPGDYSPSPSCPSCALGAARRLPPLGFPLAPFPAT